LTARIFRSLAEAREGFAPCVLTIGNFDGVHIGHQALVARTCARASARGLAASALTFDPHPATVVAPERAPETICTLEQRLALLEQAGAQQILVLPFTRQVANLSARDFVQQVLCDVLQARAVVVGESFRFGHRQAGTAATLKSLGEEFGFESQFVPPVSYRGEIVSSSLIRRYLSAGNVARAGRLLGRCFSLQGHVVSGHGVGSKQTVPTLNLPPPPGQIVPRGVYVTETLEPATGRWWPSITNCGMRPTFGGDELTIETFLLEPLVAAAPIEIEVRFRRFVRAEQQFSNAEALKAQIVRDVGRAKAYWRRAASRRAA
jgi:riboflavin kinase / FMN adenylyltransferase